MMTISAERERQGAPLRLLVINPNTNPAVTELVRNVAGDVVSPGTSVTVVNPEFGPFSIETERDRREAIPHVVSLFRSTLSDHYDAYVFACFDDIGLGECRALATVPVVGACEAGIAATRARARRFAIVTTVHAAVPGIRALAKLYGETGDICTVRAAGIGVADAATSADRTVETQIRAAVRDAVGSDGAKAILLGSAGLTGRAGSLGEQFGIPVIDSIAAAVERAEELALQPRDQ